MQIDPVRRRWTAFEPVHAVVYFAPEIPEADRAAGLKGFWMSYFAGRSAPIGSGDVGPGPELVTATFYNFAPSMVARAIPDAWTFVSPARVLATRLGAVDVVLRRVLGAHVERPELAELADVAVDAARACPIEGRALAAAWSAVPVPDEPHVRLWWACTVLREHRGDGHVAALTAAGLDGCEAHVVLAAGGAVTRTSQLGARGWTDDDWDAAVERLTERGWIDRDRLTDLGTERQRDRIEATTDRLATVPWDVIGPEATARFDTGIAPLAEAIAAAEVLSYPNPMGLPPADLTSAELVLVAAKAARAATSATRTGKARGTGRWPPARSTGRRWCRRRAS